MMARAYNLKTWEAEVGAPGIHDNTSKVYIKPYFKDTEREMGGRSLHEALGSNPSTAWYVTVYDYNPSTREVGAGRSVQL